MVNNKDNMTPNPFSKVHHGDNVVFFRELKRIQQKELAITLGWSQSVLSNLEKMPVIDDDKLKQIAEALGVSLDELKYNNARESATFYIFNKDVNNFNTGTQDSGVKNIHNPIEKITELYERMLSDKDAEITRLREQLKNK